MKCVSGKVESFDNITPKCSIECAWLNGCVVIPEEEEENT